MLLSDASKKVWLHTQPTDMRKSFNGLVALVKNVLQENPLDGQCFVFINRRKTQLKLLYFDGTGYCIWMKRLECVFLPTVNTEFYREAKVFTLR